MGAACATITASNTPETGARICQQL